MKELKIESICPHLVIDEQTSILSDMKSIRTLRPIATAQIELKINGYLIEDSTSTSTGYKLLRDPDTTERYLQFRSLRRSAEEYYEITYYTIADYCRRCNGIRVENDYQYDDTGKPVVVQYEYKLIQDLRKTILTEIGSNTFHTWYGTSIPTLIGSKAGIASITRMKIESDIRTALKRYSDTQAKLKPGSVDPRERYNRLLNLSVTQHPSDPTLYTIDMLVQNQSNQAITISTELQTPDPQSFLSYKRAV